MNIETRRFILGLIMLFVGAIVLGMYLFNLIDGTSEWWHWIAIITCLITAISGSVILLKTIN